MECHAILISQNRIELLSEVDRGPAMGRTVPVKPVSKTLAAALTRTALDRGEISSMQFTIGDLAPSLIPKSTDPRMAGITMENLETMQAGLEHASGPSCNDWVSSGDWVRDALLRPFVAEPGTRLLYSSGSFHMLGAILSEVKGQSLLHLARYRLGAPLIMEIPT